MPELAVAPVIPPAREYLSPREAALYVNASEASLARWRSNGTGPEYRLITPRMVRYARTSLDAWLAGKARTSTAAA